MARISKITAGDASFGITAASVSEKAKNGKNSTPSAQRMHQAAAAGAASVAGGENNRRRHGGGSMAYRAAKRIANARRHRGAAAIAARGVAASAWR
jgi:hypothetical protein